MSAYSALFGRLALGVGILASAGVVACSAADDEESGSGASYQTSGGDASESLKSTLVLQGGCVAVKVGDKHLLVSARCIGASASTYAVGKRLTFVSAATGQNVMSNGTDAGAAKSDAGDAGAADDDAGDDTSADDTTDDGTDLGLDDGTGDGDTDADDAGAGDDAGTPSTDAGAKADAGSSSGAARTITIAEIDVQDSYTAKCATASTCAIGKVEGSDAADVAVLILSENLETVPTIAVDLDPVGVGDEVLVAASNCDSMAEAASKPILRMTQTVAVPAKSVVHDGSAYNGASQLATRLGQSYVVTGGPAWHPKEAHLCKGDFGAPIFRAEVAAVAGITSNVTTFKAAGEPATIEHTRLDSATRFKIGDWLTGLGVSTIHSCSDTGSGCTTRSYDGGVPTPPGVTGAPTTDPGDDGGAVVVAPDGGDVDGGAEEEDSGAIEPSGDLDPSQQGSLAPDEPDPDYGEPDYSDAAVAPKKKKAASGCSVSSNGAGTGTGGTLGLAFGVALVLGAIRRRRSH